MIGVLVPAHNEAASMARCLQSIRRAALHPGLRGEAVQVVVALDDCSDATASICRQQRVDTVRLQARCVGVARAAAAAQLLQQGARWLASTDADSEVPPEWLVAQLEGRCDAFCGLVDIASTSGTASACVARSGKGSLGATITGASTAGTSVSLPAPIVPRGFAALRCGEDVALVNRLQCLGADVRWAGAPVVMTSARLVGRATGGFATYLSGIEGRVPTCHAEPCTRMKSWSTRC